MGSTGVLPERLHQLAWVWDAPLVLSPRKPYSRSQWSVKQAGRPVAAIDQTRTGWMLATAGHRFMAARRRNRFGVGWHVEITSVDQRPLLDYRPATVRNGGRLNFATGASYKLRWRLRSYDWVLSRARGDVLARILLRDDEPAGDHEIGLTPAAAREPDLTLLVASASVAIVTFHPDLPGGGPGAVSEAGVVGVAEVL